MGKLSGKVALVTGGAGGIGSAIARVLAAEGADIGIVDKNAQGARSTADEIVSLGVRTASAGADVSDEAQSEAAFAAVTKTLGDIDILCNNAGIGTSGKCRRLRPRAVVARDMAVGWDLFWGHANNRASSPARCNPFLSRAKPSTEKVHASLRR